MNISKAKLTALDAWPVVSSVLFDECTAEEITSVIRLCGLTVKWELTEQEAYSQKTRKRVYQPRVDQAYASLNDDDKARVLSVTAAELVRRKPDTLVRLHDAFTRIGWSLKSALPPTEANSSQITMQRDRTLQTLLLRELRDGVPPAELANYPEEQQVHNSALLVDERLVTGKAYRDARGIVASVVMTELTSKGHDFLEQAEERNRLPPPATPVDQKGASITRMTAIKSIFVSHSSLDKDLALAIVDLLCAALPLRRSDFRCTSVSGAGLPGGATTDDVLRADIAAMPVFLSLLTRKALASTYVLFELGARWSTTKPHIPLLANGCGAEVLKPPLSGKNALSLGNDAHVFELVTIVADLLNIRPEPVPSYRDHVQNVVTQSKKGELNACTDRANDLLRECVALIEGEGTLEAGLAAVRARQQSWKESEQVTVVKDDRVELHKLTDLVGSPASECWREATGTSQSSYSYMLTNKRGNLTSQIKDYEGRKTALAFRFLAKFSCLVVAEAHCTS